MPWLSDAEPAPSWTADQVADAIAEALAPGLPDAGHPVQTYLALMARGDDDCPGHDTQLTKAVIHGCESQDGTWFEGISEYESGPVDGIEGAEREALGGDFQIIDPSGGRLVAGGYAASTAYETADGTDWQMVLSGSWLSTPSDTALDTENSLLLEATVDHAGVLTLAGSWGAGGHHLYFEALVFDPGCEAHPTGQLQVREPAGSWYTVALSDPCLGCGPVTWGDGQDLGEVCVDLRQAGQDLAARVVGEP